MVRVFLKGGVWKNSEDEVLKAAVQKYGKQQWARVASLLNRKTAKQAKARWYEWLDPSIKKTEWSRDEEEKLLHLAKLLPAQWKTIGPMVGRTATQCQEHYEQLLDQAAAATSASASAAAGDDAHGLRTASLRAGQIDSHPETRPAKPDPIDMDEDELEMLQEARARLANTLGKKAKRKQREKMLAQAKRLADLQKRRELKAAGLLSSRARQTSRRKNEIDFGVEIPFYKPAPVGFHDTTAEQGKTSHIQQQRLRQVDLHQVNESRYRTRDLEEAKAKKREEKRLQVLEKVNQSYQKEKDLQQEAMQMASASLRQRGTLQLPDPTLTDEDLAVLAKQQQMQQGDYLGGGIGGAGMGPTMALLGDDRDRPLPTPMRTPFGGTSMMTSVAGTGTAASVAAASKSLKTAATSATSARRRDLVQEAVQLRKLERGTTPLLASAMGGGGGTDGGGADYYGPTGFGGDDDDEEDEDGDGTKTAGADDNDGDLKMPAAHVASDGASVGASTWATSTHTLRELAREQKRAAKRARLELEKALAALPEPQYEYELAGPNSTHEDDNEDDAVGVPSTVDDDQADVEEKQREERRRIAEMRYQERSSVLKRPTLPRPSGSGVSLAHDKSASNDSAAIALIQQEMARLIQHDNHKYPVASTAAKSDDKHKKKRKLGNGDDADPPLMEEVEALDPPLQVMSETSLETARQLIDDELQDLMGEKVGAVLQGDEEGISSPEEAIAVLCDRAISASRDGAKGMVYTSGGWVESPTDEQVLSSLRLEFDELRQATEALKRKNDKVESKLKVVNGGYVKLTDKCTEEMQQVLDATKNALIEQSVYKMLQSQERVGGADRIEKRQEDVKRLQALEAELQKQYGDLMVERRRKMVLASASVRHGS
jgi:pre-mRNA-splicing factor CDC5/CEF1